MNYVIANEFIRAEVSDVGAELCSLKNSDGLEYIWEGRKPYWESHACKLFPFCGRVFNDTYSYRSKDYKMTKHGLVRKMSFTRNEQLSTDRKLVLEVTDTDETYQMYPFHFVFRAIYEADDHTLICRDEIENLDDKELIYAIGGHPGFRVPLRAGDRFEDYVLDFGKDCKPALKLLSADFFDTGKTEPYKLKEDRYLPLAHSLFDNDALFFEHANHTVSVKHRLGGYGVEVSCDEALFWGIWHNPQTDAPFVCIEPWHGYPGMSGVKDELEQNPANRRVQPGQTDSFTVKIRTL